jgi:hypothetical protein
VVAVAVVVAVKIAEVAEVWSGCLFDAVILMIILIAPIATPRVPLPPRLPLRLLLPHTHYPKQQRQTMFQQLLVLHRQRSLVKQKLPLNDTNEYIKVN